MTELNARARERLAAAGLVDHEGLDVRGTTIGRGDQVIVLRNAGPPPRTPRLPCQARRRRTSTRHGCGHERHAAPE